MEPTLHDVVAQQIENREQRYSLVVSHLFAD
jgi:hypothetical protein